MQEILNTSEEIWKPIKGFEGLYEASSLGNVKSVERTCKNGYNSVRRVRERMLKPQLGGREGEQYLQVKLSKNGVSKTYGVHVLVALAFPEICGLPFEGAQCNHIDEDHFRNVPSNLNWLSVQDNINHGTRNERSAKARSKTVYQYTTTTHELVQEWESLSEVYRQMGWSSANISKCCNNCYNPNGTGAHNVYKNYVWSYSKCDYPKNDRF